MIKLVDRYIGKAAIQGTLVIWFGLTLMFMLFSLLSELRDSQNNYTTGDAFWFVALTSPRMAYQVFPVSALLGALVGVGGLAAGNELVAFRTSGVSRLRLAAAALAGTGLLTMLVVAMGEWVKLKLYTRMNTPGSSNGIIRLWIDDELKVDYTDVNIRENTSYGFGKLIMGSYATQASGSDGYEWFDGWVLSATDPEGAGPGANPATPSGVSRTDVMPEGN